ncbi:hypothetical protein Patl1_14833 [Pistacia atlantica]|uniref:Uncharacterized protein n=1 Tax=Pistacia atlantica TaxID=434234 RepID=A0ACC1AXS1_9ROSI|nr:hypothetical protein Patl1_14833 [Pistacia atlantica]
MSHGLLHSTTVTAISPLSGSHTLPPFPPSCSPPPPSLFHHNHPLTPLSPTVSSWTSPSAPPSSALNVKYTRHWSFWLETLRLWSLKAFMLRHSRAGVVSLCLSENDDEEEIKLDPDYRNVEFLITTGPGPCPQLDSKNIVFGVVLEGQFLIEGWILSRPLLPFQHTNHPKESSNTMIWRGFSETKELSKLAQFGIDLLKPVYISDCGELKVTKPSLSPSLP